MEIVSISRTAKIAFLLIGVLLLGIILVKIFVKTCPDSCDDFNVCTQDVCSSDTDHECKHVNIEGPVTGCLGKPEGCRQKGCNKGECDFVFVKECCGNNLCESKEDTETCPNDCLVSLSNHFNSLNKGQPDVAYWNTKAFRVTFDKLAVQNEKNDCILKFKTSESTVVIDINGNKANFNAKQGWNDYKFACKALKGSEDVITISSDENIQAYFEQVNLTDSHIDQYTVDGERWLEHQYDIAVDVYEVRYMLW